MLGLLEIAEKPVEKPADRDLSVYDINITPSNPFPLPLDLHPLLQTSISKARIKLKLHSQYPTPSRSRPNSHSESTIKLDQSSQSVPRLTLKERLQALLTREEMLKMLECLYWLVVSKQFFEESTRGVQKMLREKMGRLYMEMMVMNLEKMKEDYLEFIPLIYSHCICTDIYTRFPNSRSLITESFILSTTHLVFLYLLGFSTSDVFVRQQLSALYQSQAFNLDLMIEE